MWEVDKKKFPPPGGRVDIVAAGFSLRRMDMDILLQYGRRLKPAATIFILLILLAVAPLGAETGGQAYQHVKVTCVSDKGQFSFDTEMARNQEQFTLGLMHRPQLGKDKGMLFVFPDNAERYFWMKDTLIPLDIIFISEFHRVVNIAQEAQPCPQLPCPTYDSKKPVKYVVEINGGLSRKMGLKAGDKVDFNLK